MWFYRTAAGEIGPVPGEEMVRLIEAGEITETTPVRRDGSDQWLEAWQTDRAGYLRTMSATGVAAIDDGRPASVPARIGAYIVDYLGVVFTSMFVGFIFGFFFETPSEVTDFTQALPQLSITFVVIFLFYGLPGASEKQATFGMQALGIRMKRSNGAPIGLIRAGLRPMFASISGIVFGLGLLVAFLTHERITFHDWVCGTRVIRGDA